MSSSCGVIWDIDGTLLDSNTEHAKAFLEAFAVHGFDYDLAKIKKRIGMGGDKLIPDLLGYHDSKLEKQIAESKKQIFFDKYFSLVRPFPCIKELLEGLKKLGFMQSVGTSASREECERFLELLGIRPYLREIVTSDQVEASKPDPDIVAEAVKKLKLSKSDVIMIGDTPYDIEAAARAGVRSIAFRSGGWTDRDLIGSIAIYDGAKDLLKSLDSFQQFFSSL